MIVYPSGGGGGGGGGVASVTAGDNTITIGGTAANPTVAVNQANLTAKVAAVAAADATIVIGGTAANPTIAMGVAQQGNVNNGYVDLVNPQSIAGIKTFTSNIIATPPIGATSLLINAPTGMANNLLDLQVNASSQFKVTQTGGVTISGTGNVNIVNGSIVLQSATAGIIQGPGTLPSITFKRIDASVAAEQSIIIIPAGTTTFTANTATNRQVLINAPTLAGSAATKTITDAATLAITGAPIVGANAAITRTYQLWLQGTDSMRIDTTTVATVGAAGAATALPALPLGYLPIYVGATLVKIPYYNP